MAIHEHFDQLFTTDCLYGRPQIDGNTIRIRVNDLGLMKGHPLRPIGAANLVYLSSCYFVFERVTSSQRKLTPYVGDPKAGRFGAEHVEHDGPFSPAEGGQEYAFEGRIEDPLAYVDWCVVAGSFCLETPVPPAFIPPLG